MEGARPAIQKLTRVEEGWQELGQKIQWGGAAAEEDGENLSETEEGGWLHTGESDSEGSNVPTTGQGEDDGSREDRAEESQGVGEGYVPRQGEGPQ